MWYTHNIIINIFVQTESGAMQQGCYVALNRLCLYWIDSKTLSSKMVLDYKRALLGTHNICTANSTNGSQTGGPRSGVLKTKWATGACINICKICFILYLIKSSRGLAWNSKQHLHKPSSSNQCPSPLSPCSEAWGQTQWSSYERLLLWWMWEWMCSNPSWSTHWILRSRGCRGFLIVFHERRMTALNYISKQSFCLKHITTQVCRQLISYVFSALALRDCGFNVLGFLYMES